MPTINGQEYQHGLINVQLSGSGGTFQLKTFSDLQYEDGAEKKPVNDATGDIVGYTIDNRKTSGSITIRLSEYFTLDEWAAQQYPDLGLGQIAFNWAVSFGNTPSTLRTERLYGVMFNKNPRKSSNNQEALTVELPLFILRIEGAGGRAFIQY